MTRHRSRRIAAGGLLGSLVSVAGCERSPNFNVLGSYFPGWIAAFLVAIIGTTALHLLLRRFGLEQHLPKLPLFYFCVAVLLASSFWLLTFA